MPFACPLLRQSLLEHLVEKLPHRFPGSVVGLGVVSSAFAIVSTCHGLSERVDGMGIIDHLPIDRCRIQLRLKRIDVLGRNEGIIRAVQHEDL